MRQSLYICYWEAPQDTVQVYRLNTRVWLHWTIDWPLVHSVVSSSNHRLNMMILMLLMLSLSRVSTLNSVQNFFQSFHTLWLSHWGWHIDILCWTSYQKIVKFVTSEECVQSLVLLNWRIFPVSFLRVFPCMVLNEMYAQELLTFHIHTLMRCLFPSTNTVNYM